MLSIQRGIQDGNFVKRSAGGAARIIRQLQDPAESSWLARLGSFAAPWIGDKSRVAQAKAYERSRRQAAILRATRGAAFNKKSPIRFSSSDTDPTKARVRVGRSFGRNVDMESLPADIQERMLRGPYNTTYGRVLGGQKPGNMSKLYAGQEEQKVGLGVGGGALGLGLLSSLGGNKDRGY
jgi:hypothetical protein